MKFGDYLRQTREQRGWTQPEAAAKANIEQSYLSKLETGKSYPSEDIFNRLVEAYSINITSLTRTVFSEELDKLREIADVRTAVLARQQTESRYMRSWLIAGLIMLMLSGGMLGLAFNTAEPESLRYHYRSEGVIMDGEPPTVFDFLDDLDHTGPETTHLLHRVDYAFVDTTYKQADDYIERVEGGYRRFRLHNVTEESQPSLIGWHYAFGFMFLFGGLGCFFISRRWQ